MGRRGRRSGIANAALRAAKAARAERDDEAHEIAQRVYNFVVTMKRERQVDEPLPMAVWAPVQVAAELAAPGAAKLAQLPVDEQTSLDVAAYLLAGFREMVVQLDPEHFEKWRRELDAVAVSDDRPG